MAFRRNASALAALLLAGCGGQGAVRNSAQLRFFDAFADQSNVRFTVGGRLYRAGSVGPSIENGDEAIYTDVPSGTIDLVVQTYDRNTTLATLTAQRLTPANFYTAVALTAGTTKKIVLVRDSSVQTAGAALFRVIDAYTTNTPVFLRLFKDSDHSLAYQTNTTSGTGLAGGGTTGYQSVVEANADGSSYTLRVYDASDFANEIGSKSVTLKSGTPVTFFLHNKRSSTDMAVRTAEDRSSG